MMALRALCIAAAVAPRWAAAVALAAAGSLPKGPVTEGSGGQRAREPFRPGVLRPLRKPGPLAGPAPHQVWISLRVATDVLPLLVHACSQECVNRLPSPAEGYVARPHRGGLEMEQPPPQG